MELIDKAIRLAKQHETKIRFGAAGVVNTAFGLAIFPILFFSLAFLKLHYLIILTISQALSVTLAFVTNKFWVFRTKGNYLREYGKFVLFHLTYFVVNLFALPFLVEVVKIPPVWAQSGFAVAVIVSSYVWHSRITFSSNGAKH